MQNGTGAVPTFHSGGQGYKFIMINVVGKYGYGIHFKVIVYGRKPMKVGSENTTSIITSSNVVR
jgi:hypothetical protein